MNMSIKAISAVYPKSLPDKGFQIPGEFEVPKTLSYIPSAGNVSSMLCSRFQ